MNGTQAERPEEVTWPISSRDEDPGAGLVEARKCCDSSPRQRERAVHSASAGQRLNVVLLALYQCRTWISI